jgi:hypothetical protein
MGDKLFETMCLYEFSQTGFVEIVIVIVIVIGIAIGIE